MTKNISIRVQKELYAKSGNICAFPGCNQNLISNETNNSNICHIISKKPNGPRHDPNYKNYDHDENLILLCLNHHNEVDKNVDKYTVDALRNMKEMHEQSIRELFENNIEVNNLKSIFLKAIDDYNIVDIIQNEDYSSSFHSYKLINLIGFTKYINCEILTEYNKTFYNENFIFSMKSLVENFENLYYYLDEHTETYDNGRFIKTKEGYVLNTDYITSLRVLIAGELSKYLKY